MPIWERGADVCGQQVSGKTMDVRAWFEFAWNRELPWLEPPMIGPQLNLGAGYREVEWAQSVDLEHSYDLDQGDLERFEPDSIAAIWAHGVFEHLSRPIEVLRDCERILMKGGVLNIVVPHGASYLQLEDPTHRTAWTEESWKAIFSNEYYSPDGSWKLRVQACFIIGVVWRNLALFTQLIKE